MLRQASIAQIRSGEISRDRGYVIASMCYYPRGLRRVLLDEYRHDLAPDRALFKEWKTVEKKEGHDAAFRRTRYEKRFRLTPEAIETIAELAQRSHRNEIYLACQCAIGERCHREMLLQLAYEAFGAKIGPIYNDYPVFRKRYSGSGFTPVKGARRSIEFI